MLRFGRNGTNRKRSALLIRFVENYIFVCQKFNSFLMFCFQVTRLFVDVPRLATLEAVITIKPSTNTFVCVRPDSLETDVKQVIT